MSSLTCVVVFLDKREMDVVREHAKRVEIGGLSNIRGIDRTMNLSLDQLVGQAGEAALSKFLTGSIDLYHKTRLEREKNIHSGDNGSDLIGWDVDVKTSVARRGLNFPYHLWVRPREYHPDTTYYLALVPENVFDSVVLIGWVQGKYMKLVEDKYELAMDDLNSMFHDWEVDGKPDA